MDITQLLFLFQEKLGCYQALIEVLKAERAWIVSADTGNLWRASDEKQKIAASIEAIRERILEALSASGVSHGMTRDGFRISEVIRLLPAGARKSWLPLQGSLGLLKEEVQRRSRENTEFVEAYLTTVSDLIGIFTATGNDGDLYNRKRHVESKKSHPLMHREV